MPCPFADIQDESFNVSDKLMLPLEKYVALRASEMGECPSPTPSTRSGASSRPFSWADLDVEDDDLTDDENPCNAVRTPKNQCGQRSSPLISNAFPTTSAKSYAVPKNLDAKPHVGCYSTVTVSQTRRVQKVRSVVAPPRTTPTAPYFLDECETIDECEPMKNVEKKADIQKSARCSPSVVALAAIFRRFDVDRDGLLSHTELATFAEACGSQPLSIDEYGSLCEALEIKLGRPLEDPQRGFTSAEFLKTYHLCNDAVAAEEMIANDYERCFGLSLTV